MNRFNPHNNSFVVLLGCLSALSPLSIDMSLPALPAIASAFGEEPARATRVISAYLTGYSLGQLVYGPASDRFGRRPIILIGIFIFTIAGFACSFSSSMDALIAWRLFQGTGGAALTPIIRAMIRDVHDDPRRARVLFSQVNMSLLIAPVVAPTLGSIFLSIFPGSWRSIFIFATIAGAALLGMAILKMPETISIADKGALLPSRLASNYLRFLRKRRCIANAMIGALICGCMFSYVAGSSLVFVTVMGLNRSVFSGIFASIAVCMVCGSFLNARIAVTEIPARKILMFALISACVGAASALAATALLVPKFSFWPTLIGLMVAAMSFGFIMPITSHAALEPVPEVAGVASAMLGFIQMLTGAAASALVGWIFPHIGIAAMASVMTACAFLAICLFPFTGHPLPNISLRPDEKKSDSL